MEQAQLAEVEFSFQRAKSTPAIIEGARYFDNGQCSYNPSSLRNCTWRICGAILEDLKKKLADGGFFASGVQGTIDGVMACRCAVVQHWLDTIKQ